MRALLLIVCLQLAPILAFASPASTTTAAAPATTPRFEPAACGFHGVPAQWAVEQRIDCGWLHVSESRGKPDSRKLKLWVAIARADADGKREDPLLYIHGGPGPATVDYFFPYFPQSKTWPAFRRTRDIVFFDQRGTGRSEPAFCKELAATLETVERESPPPREALERSRAAFAACRARMLAEGFDFSAYNSTATVEDAEDLRHALGIARWNLYGISYGTLVGLEYLRNHPGSVRAAILDSVFPPNSPNGAEQLTATALAFEALQRACDRQPACRARFPDITAQLAQAIGQLDAAPIARDGGGRITGASLGGALWSMLVGTRTAPWVPLAVSRVAAGDERAINDLVSVFGGSGGFGELSFGQAQTVNCYEVMVGDTTTAVRNAARKYPYFATGGEIAERNDVLCAAWQHARAPMEFFAPVQSTVPVLLYGGEFDPATPYDDAVLASRYLNNSTLVLVEGASHAGMGVDDCTRGIAHAFLAQPTHDPDLACLRQRPTVEFPVDGLAEFLASMKR